MLLVDIPPQICKNADVHAGTSGLISKRNRPKFLKLHSPFCLLIRKKYSNCGHSEYFKVYCS